MKTLICIDSNSLSFLIDAMTIGRKPDGEVAAEKIALLRIYLYRDEILCISPTVKAEYEKIKDEKNRRNHQDVADILLGDTQPSDLKAVELRSREYAKSHPGKRNEKDCRILAEAELGECAILLTYDLTFLNKLCYKTRSIKMMAPSEYWQKLNLPKGVQPVKEPYPTNPLSKETWWIWR
jgi:hypothetical protein